VYKLNRVSVIIPTHNRAARLRRAITSAKESASDVEVIVVDDASSDNTREVCRDFDYVRYIRFDENRRTAAARNAGIEAATGEYLAFLDDDDIRIPGTLQKQLELLDLNPDAGLAYGQYLNCDQNGTLLNMPPFPEICEEGDVFWRLLRPEGLIGNSTFVVRKSVVDIVGTQDTSERMYGVEDWDFLIRIAACFPVVALHEPVALYRLADVSSDQWCSRAEEQYVRVIFAFRNKWLKLPKAISERTADELQQMEKEITDHYAEMLLLKVTEAKDHSEKIRRLRMALRVKPRLIQSTYFYKVAVRNLVLGTSN